jgi:antitoxin component YwqK of YwqJK toxin-antitoxin module
MSSIVISQNIYHVDKTTFALQDTVVLLKYDMKPINGVLFCDYGNMGIYSEGKLKDGLFRSWHTNGQLKWEYNIKYGNRDGLIRNWYDNGQLKYEFSDKDGLTVGLVRKWFDDGQLWYECNYKDGMVNGLFRGWLENGQLDYEHNYKDGKLDGLCKTWLSDGQLLIQIYRDGKVSLSWCSDGNGNQIPCRW